MYATLTANMATWREPVTRRGRIRRWAWVLAILLSSIPLMLSLLREVFAQSWKDVTGPFDHVSIYAVMVYGDSVLVVMLLCIGLFELLLWRQQRDASAFHFFHSWWWWAMLAPCFVAGQQFLDQFNEPRHGPIIYRQAWVFDLYHDLVAGLVIHQLLAVLCLLWVAGRTGLTRGATAVLLFVLLLLGTYIGIWREQPQKHVIRHGIVIDFRGYGGTWAVDRLYQTGESGS